jgi:hypothetical protein
MLILWDSFLAFCHDISEENVLQILFKKEKVDKFSKVFFPKYVPAFFCLLWLLELNWKWNLLEVNPLYETLSTCKLKRRRWFSHEELVWGRLENDLVISLAFEICLGFLFITGIHCSSFLCVCACVRVCVCVCVTGDLLRYTRQHSTTQATPPAFLFSFWFWDRVSLPFCPCWPRIFDPLASASQVAGYRCAPAPGWVVFVFGRGEVVWDTGV